jgi:hypothetical protein
MANNPTLREIELGIIIAEKDEEIRKLKKTLEEKDSDFRKEIEKMKQ